jgi:hypothetical protein
MRRVLGLVLSVGLVALALGALGVSSASAATAPGEKVCKKVPSGLSGKGLYKEPNCTGNEVSGAYAWAWADEGGKSTIYCLLKSGGPWGDPLCSTGTGLFEEFLVKGEAFPKHTGLLLLSILVGHAATLPTTIHCGDGDFSSQPVTATLSQEITITYLACTVSAPANCEVDNAGGVAGTIKTEKLNGLLESLTLTNFTPASENKFVEIEYKGTSCTLKGDKFPIKGSQMCEWNAGSSEPAILHLLNCKKTGSALKLGEEKAEYEGLTHVSFESNPYWKVW